MCLYFHILATIVSTKYLLEEKKIFSTLTLSISEVPKPRPSKKYTSGSIESRDRKRHLMNETFRSRRLPAGNPRDWPMLLWDLYFEWKISIDWFGFWTINNDMPRRCVVAGCSNTAKEGVSLHSFPKDEHFRKLWTQKVKLTRADWDGPSPFSFVCSAHFPEDAFEAGLHSRFGIKRLRRLKLDAIPVIRLQQGAEGEAESSTSHQRKPRAAVEKRKRIRVS